MYQGAVWDPIFLSHLKATSPWAVRKLPEKPGEACPPQKLPQGPRRVRAVAWPKKEEKNGAAGAGSGRRKHKAISGTKRRETETEQGVRGQGRRAGENLNRKGRREGQVSRVSAAALTKREVSAFADTLQPQKCTEVSSPCRLGASDPCDLKGIRE